MYRKYIFKALPCIIAFPILATAFTNCSNFSPAEDASQTFGSMSTCPRAPSTLQNPQGILQAIALINALPKPLELDCFVENLQRPLGVFAVNNTFSAQPAGGPTNPRILMISSALIMSVVPVGTGRLLLELSENVDGVNSVKAEIQFPVTRDLVTEDAFTHLVDSSGVTECRVCHQNEQPAGGVFPLDAKKSGILRPDSFERITSASMLQQAQVCDPRIEPYRCRILNAVFIDGRARDVAFP